MGRREMGRQAWRGHDTAVDCIENGEGRTHRPSRSSKHKWQDATPREQSRSSKHKGPRAELVRSTDDDDLEEELEMEASALHRSPLFVIGFVLVVGGALIGYSMVQPEPSASGVRSAGTVHRPQEEQAPAVATLPSSSIQCSLLCPDQHAAPYDPTLDAPPAMVVGQAAPRQIPTTQPQEVLHEVLESTTAGARSGLTAHDAAFVPGRGSMGTASQALQRPPPSPAELWDGPWTWGVSPAMQPPPLALARQVQPSDVDRELERQPLQPKRTPVSAEADDTQPDEKALPTAGMQERSQSVTSISSTSPPTLPPPLSTPPPSPPPSASPSSPPPSPAAPAPEATAMATVTWENLGGQKLGLG